MSFEEGPETIYSSYQDHTPAVYPTHQIAE